MESLRLLDREISLWAEILVVVCWGAVASYLGVLAGSLVLPVLQLTAIAYVFLVETWRGRIWRAAGLVLLWSVTITVVVAWYAYTAGCSSAAAARVIKASDYTREMLYWIKTGVGPEGDPSLFLIPKIEELALFMVVSFVTVGIGGLFMGAILLNYMNYYYGTLLWLSRDSAIVAAMGWPIYAIIRVVGYVFLGTFLTRTMLSIIGRRHGGAIIDRELKKMLLIALVLIALDFILKATIANALYQPILHDSVDLDRLEACRAALTG